MAVFRILLWVVAMVTFDLDLVRGQTFSTTNGQVKGKTIDVMGKSLDVFFGIPFAKPPIGDLRFKYPKPADSWSPQVKDATTKTPSCIQSGVLFASIPYAEPFIMPNDFSEDCLHLNIWKPSNARNGSNLAVMVWIFGGGFSAGSTRVHAYNSQYLVAENDVIVVTVNYRVGPLGFSFLGPDTIPGNMGLMDQVEAIRWVKNNIENFGGDKNRITLFGESAGAMSVGYHLLSPLSRDLFNNGILESGSPIQRVVSRIPQNVPVARNNTLELAKAVGCADSSQENVLKCLKSLDAQSINDGFNRVAPTGVNFMPVVDGFFFPNDPVTIIQRGEHKKTNILMGVNKDEATLFFYNFINPRNKTFRAIGELFSNKHFQMVIPKLTNLRDRERVKALEIFYETQTNPPLDYLQVLNHLSSDFLFKCPTLLFTSVYSESNDVYLYSLDHRVSTMPHPEWMGVPHAFEIELVFGLPVNDSLGYTSEEKDLSKNVMTYWSNFAKTGNPNTGSPVTPSWPVFNKENLTYMALDVGSKLISREGFRRHQCAFINDILPMIPKHEDINKPTTTSSPDCVLPVNGGSRQCPGCVYVILSLLTVFFWMLHG